MNREHPYADLQCLHCGRTGGLEGFIDVGGLGGSYLECSFCGGQCAPMAQWPEWSFEELVAQQRKMHARAHAALQKAMTAGFEALKNRVRHKPS